MDAVLSRKDILRMSGPLLIETMMTTFLGFITSLMVGNISSAAISAVSYVNTITDLVVALLTAIGTGASVVIAQQIGARKYEEAKQASGQTFLLGVLLGTLVMVVLLVLIKPLMLFLLGAAEQAVYDCAFQYFLFSVLSYPFQAVVTISSGILRGSGNTKPGMLLSLLMNLVNVGVGLLLIYGLRFGFIGAGIGLLVARITGAVFGVFLLRRVDTRYAIGKIPRRFDPAVQKQLLRIGIPVAVEGLLFNGGRFLTQTYCVYMGTAQMAANALCNSVVGLAVIPGTALGLVSTTVVGMDVGAGRPDCARRDMRFLLRLAMGISLVACTAVYLLLPWILGAFGAEPEVFQITLPCMQLITLASPIIWTLGFVTPYGLKGAGDIVYTTVTALVSMFLFRVFLGYVLGIRLQMYTYGVQVAMIIDWVARAALYYRRFLGKRWLAQTSTGAESGVPEAQSALPK